MKKAFAAEKLMLYLLILAILIILVAFVVPRIEGFKELFTNLLGKFEGIPSINEVDKVADYVDRYIPLVNVKDFRKNGDYLIYYFPDIHTTTMHRQHYKTILELNKHFGLSLVGLEGQEEGRVTEENLEEDFVIIKRRQEMGIYYQLSKNEAELFGGDPKKIETLDNFLEVSPLLNLVRNDKIVLVGLERKAQDVEEKLKELKTFYIYFFDAFMLEYKYKKEMDSLRKEIKDLEVEISDARLLGKEVPKEKEEDLEQLKQQLTSKLEAYPEIREKITSMTRQIKVEMDKIKEELGPTYEFPDYLEGFLEAEGLVFRTSFFEKLENYIKKTKITQRSLDAVDLILSQMEERNVKQAAIVFGEDHTSEIIEEFNKRGISYIIIEYGE